MNAIFGQDFTNVMDLLIKDGPAFVNDKVDGILFYCGDCYDGPYISWMNDQNCGRCGSFFGTES